MNTSLSYVDRNLTSMFRLFKKNNNGNLASLWLYALEALRVLNCSGFCKMEQVINSAFVRSHEMKIGILTSTKSHFLWADISTNRRGTCLTWSFLTKALMDSSCMKGCRQTLNVLSIYQDFDRAWWCSCSSVAKIRWCRLWAPRSDHRKPVGMCSSSRSKSRSLGSSGWSFCRKWFACLAS